MRANRITHKVVTGSLNTGHTQLRVFFEKKRKMKKSKIQVEVTLDDDKVPMQIRWKAEDGNIPGFREVKSIFLSLYDTESEETMKLDLWTKEFRVDEMDKFVFQTLRTMADSYYKATNNGDMANHMVQFAQFFGTETGILTPQKPEDGQTPN